MKQLFTLSLLLALSACESEQTFTLNVQRPLVAAVKPGRSETVTIPTGSYSMLVTTGPQTSKITLSGRGSPIVFRTKSLKSIADDLNTRGDNRVVLTAAQLKQTFDVEVSSKRTLLGTGREERHSESCVYDTITRYREVCTPGETRCYGGHEECRQRSGTNGDGRSDFDCYTVGETCTTSPSRCYDEPYEENIYGSRDYSGREISYKTVTNIRFIQNRQTAASVDAKVQNYTEFDRSWTGDCRR